MNPTPSKAELTALLRLLDSAGDLAQILVSRSYDQLIEYTGPNEILKVVDDSVELQRLIEINAHLVAAKCDVLNMI